MLSVQAKSLKNLHKHQKLGHPSDLNNNNDDDYDEDEDEVRPKNKKNCKIRPTSSSPPSKSGLEIPPQQPVVHFFSRAECSSPKEIEKILNGGSNFKKIGVETIVRKIIDAKFCLSRQNQKCLLSYLASSNQCDRQIARLLLTDLLTSRKFTNCVSSELIDLLIEFSSISLIRLFIDNVLDFSEECAVKIVRYCVREDQEEDENLSLDKQILLRRLFRLQFCVIRLTDELKILTAREATVLMRFLTIFLSNSQINGDKNGEYANFEQMLNMAGICLDAFSLNFHRSDEFRQEVKNLEAIVTSSIFIVDLFRIHKNYEKMQKLKKNRIKDDYSIEILIL